MATITIKLESDELARDVLYHLGYLPSEDDDIPDLISVCSESEDPVAEEVHPAPKTHVEDIHERMVPLGTRKMPDTPKEPVVGIPDGVDDGFGTPLDQTEVDQETQDKFMDVDARQKAADLKWKREQKEKKQLDQRVRAAVVKDRLSSEEYVEYLKRLLSSSNDPDIEDIVYELLGDNDADYLKYSEEKDRISYKQYLNESC